MSKHCEHLVKLVNNLLSFAVQRGNAAGILGTVPSDVSLEGIFHLRVFGLVSWSMIDNKVFLFFLFVTISDLHISLN